MEDVHQKGINVFVEEHTFGLFCLYMQACPPHQNDVSFKSRHTSHALGCLLTMSSFPSLTPRADLEQLFCSFPKGAESLMALHDDLLRKDDSELTIGERELFTAFVSVLNTCEYCFGAHRTTAEAFGVDPHTISQLMSDIDTADIPERLKPLVKFSEKVTKRESVLPADTRAVFDAGWSEQTLQDVLMITCLYNFMNRLVDGAGLSPKLSYERPSAGELERRRNGTYLEWGKKAGFISR